MRGRERRLWLVLASLIFVAITSWQLSSPLFSYPDEAAHVVRAESVVRGQLVGRDVGYHHGPFVYPYYEVQVPGLLMEASDHGTCLAFQTARPASVCPSSLHGPPGAVGIETYVGTYPPLFYLLVGLPSLAWPGTTGIFFMRVLAGGLCAMFLASALVSALGVRRGRVAALGVLVAVTPAALYLSGGVSPAGVEIASAVSLWAAALALVATDSGEQSGRLVRRAGLAASVLVWTRALSPFWLACVFVACLVLSGRGRRGTLSRRPDVRRWAVAVGVLTAGALAWDFGEDAFQVMGKAASPTTSNLTLLGEAFGHSWSWLQGAFGDFGAVDHEKAPTLLLLLCVSVLAALVVGGLRVATVRQSSVLLGLIGATVLLPVLITFADDRKLGVVWQGRYGLPLAAGVPILAAFVLANSERPAAQWFDRACGLAYGAIVAANVIGLWTSLHRFVAGNAGPFDLIGGTWQPPVNALVLFLVFAGTQALLAWTLYRVGRLPAIVTAPAAATPVGIDHEGVDALVASPKKETGTATPPADGPSV